MLYVRARGYNVERLGFIKVMECGYRDQGYVCLELEVLGVTIWGYKSDVVMFL